MICFSVNLDRFIRPSLGRADSSYFWLSFTGHVTGRSLEVEVAHVSKIY